MIPSVVILAGPNGAGKSTAAPALLEGTLAVNEFVNADVMARDLSADDPDSAAIAAGRVMLTRLSELAGGRGSFAFETTLASRTFAPWLRDLRASGYDVQLVFLWLPSADFAIERVADRVRSGGHNVPEETIRRRYGSPPDSKAECYSRGVDVTAQPANRDTFRCPDRGVHWFQGSHDSNGGSGHRRTRERPSARSRAPG